MKVAVPDHFICQAEQKEKLRFLKKKHHNLFFQARNSLDFFDIITPKYCVEIKLSDYQVHFSGVQVQNLITRTTKILHNKKKTEKQNKKLNKARL